MLREDLLRELSSAADLLSQLAATGRLEDARTYHQAAWRVDAARAVLSRIGVVVPEVEHAGELRFDEHTGMVYKAASARYTRALQEAEDAEREGHTSPELDPALAEFVTALRREIARQGSGLGSARGERQ